MSELVLYTHPMSRGRVVRWMLEEVGAPYRTEVIEYGEPMKGPEYRAINPMGKVPALRHGDTVVTEVAAICAYLADAFPQAGLAPAPEDRGAYYRWMFFVAGPLEQAWTNTAAGFQPPPDKQRMMGYGTLDLVIDTLERAVDGTEFLAAGRFTAADLLLAANLGFGMAFGMIPRRPAFERYATPKLARPARARAEALDGPMPH